MSEKYNGNSEAEGITPRARGETRKKRQRSENIFSWAVNYGYYCNRQSHTRKCISKDPLVAKQSRFKEILTKLSE